MDALQMQSPRDCPVSGPVYSISPNSGRTERGLAHGGTGAGDKTRPVLQIYIKAATILQMDGIRTRTGLHLYLSLCPGPHLAPCPLGGKAGDGLRPGSIPILALPQLVWCSWASGWARSQKDLQEVTPQAQRRVLARCRLLGRPHFQDRGVGSLGIPARVGTRAWPLQGRNLFSLQGVDVMKNSPQSPAGFNVVNFPSQLEKRKERRRECYRPELQRWGASGGG